MENIYEACCWQDSGFWHPGGAKGTKKLAAWERQYRDCRGGNFLDLCCGDGGAMPWFADYGDRRYGIDCSEKLLEQAKMQFPQCHFVCGDVRRGLPFADGWAKTVLCECSLSLFGLDRPQLLEEIRRILRPGGLLLVADITWAEVPEPVGFECLLQAEHPEWVKRFVADWLWQHESLPPLCPPPDASSGTGSRAAQMPGYFLGAYRRCD